jgi:hypothetical protein
VKAIVVGYGGIGKNVYVPQLENLGYDIDVVDPFYTFAEYGTVNDTTSMLYLSCQMYARTFL